MFEVNDGIVSELDGMRREKEFLVLVAISGLQLHGGFITEELSSDGEGRWYCSI